jgi:hypothetical protein
MIGALAAKVEAIETRVVRVERPSVDQSNVGGSAAR